MILHPLYEITLITFLSSITFLWYHFGLKRDLELIKKESIK